MTTQPIYSLNRTSSSFKSDSVAINDWNRRSRLILPTFPDITKAHYDEADIDRPLHDYVYYAWNNVSTLPLYQDFLFLDAIIRRPSNMVTTAGVTQRDAAFRAFIGTMLPRNVPQEQLAQTNTDIVNLRKTVNTQVDNLTRTVTALRGDLDNLERSSTQTPGPVIDVSEINSNFIKLQDRLNKVVIHLQGFEDPDSDLLVRSKPLDTSVIPVNLVASRLSSLGQSARVTLPSSSSRRTVHIEFLPSVFGSFYYFLSTGPTTFPDSTILTCSQIESSTVLVDQRLRDNYNTIVQSYVFEVRQRLLIAFFSFVTTGEWPIKEPSAIYEFADFTRHTTPTYLRSTRRS